MDSLWPYIIGAVILVGAFLLGRSSASPETITIYEQKPIDENTWVRRSSYDQRGNIIDRLSEEADSLQQILRARDGEILNLTQAKATLRLQRDSARTIQPIELPQLAEIADTTSHITESYDNNLFTIRVDYGVRQGAIFAEVADFTQQRPIAFDVVTDRRGDVIETFIFSPDFENIEFYTYYNIDQPRLQWYHWTGIGFTAATLLYIIL